MSFLYTENNNNDLSAENVEMITKNKVKRSKTEDSNQIVEKAPLLDKLYRGGDEKDQNTNAAE